MIKNRQKKQYIKLSFYQPLLKNIKQIVTTSRYQRFVKRTNILTQNLKLAIQKTE